MNLHQVSGSVPSTPDGSQDSVYVRLSVTDRCNLRCIYCRDGETDTAEPRREILRYEEILSLLDTLHSVVPVRKVRITGGEPLIRAELATLIAGLRHHLPHAEICLTTNGTLLARHAAGLRQAGLHRINVSLDSTDARRHAELTRGGSLDEVLAGLRAASEAGFTGTKVNVVLLRSRNGDQLAHLVRTAARHACEVRFIELMPMGTGASLFDQEFLAADEALARLCRTMVDRGEVARSATARVHRLVDGSRTVRVGFVTPMSQPFCDGCDRLRLDCRGRLFACLRHAAGVDLATPLRHGTQDAVSNQIRGLYAAKLPGSGWPQHRMVAIGG